MKERDPDAKPPGRNDDCWCGSGKKYKKCHLLADDEARVARLKTAEAVALGKREKDDADAAAAAAAEKKGGAVLRRGFEGAGATNKPDHKKTRK